jgi:hypothetical protein
VQALWRQPRTKSALKKVAEHLNANTSALMMIPDEPTRKKFKKTMEDGFGKEVFSAISLPVQDWCTKVYSPYLYGYARSYVSVQMPHMAAMEASVIFEGYEVVAGVPIEQVEGRTIKEKRQNLTTMGLDRLRTLLKDSGGFIVRHDSARLLVIPTGFMLLTASPAARGARWSLSGDVSDTLRTRHTLAGVLESYPEMGNASTGYGQWKAWLDSMG